MEPLHDNPRDERGVAMIYVTVFLLSSLWFVSLALDMGKLTTTRTELQKAADAAALAGASAIDPATGTIVRSLARDRAYETAISNTALRETAEPVVIDKNADVDFPTAYRVRVRVHREAATGNPVRTIFARTIGITALNVTADATAEAVPLSSVCEGLAPFAPVDVPGSYSTACGTTYELKVASGKGQQGNFQLLEFPPCDEGPCAGIGGGAAGVKCYIENGYGCCVKIGDMFVDTEPGNKVGPVKKALQDRWDADTDQRENICYQEYTGNRKRLFTVPIVETFDVNGKKKATIKSFGAFFLVTKPGKGGQNSVATGQFIEYMAPGEPGPSPPPETKIYGVRLVE